MAAARRSKFKRSMKEKRAGGGKAGRTGEILSKEELIVQRLSSEVSGKQQKYSRVGPMEFVAYEYEEVTAENIKTACKKHFKPKLGTVCDILAGEQGPSCKSVDQIPDLKVIHIRFIDTGVGEGDSDEPADDAFDDEILLAPAFKKKRKGFHTKSSSTHKVPEHKQVVGPSKAVPKRLSVLDMMKLNRANYTLQV